MEPALSDVDETRQLDVVICHRQPSSRRC